MDFSYLLDLAKKNEEYAKEAVQVKRYSTQVSAPKKEPRSGVQSDSIRKFLARKEQEEQQKLKDEKTKREQLLALRAQDRKSNARVQAMLSRTKAATKAVLDEARNCRETAVTAAGLDAQPDEDDYGYVSQEASQFYQKLMDKYNSGSSTDKYHSQKVRSQKELNNAKDRVKEALHKIEEDESTVHRKRRKKNLVEVNEVPEKKASSSKDQQQAKKNRPKGPPPPEATLSFDEILKLAAAKQHEPVKVEKKVENVKKSAEPERLMTKKEKEEKEKELLRQKERQLRKEGKLPPLSASAAPVAPTKSKDKDKPAVCKPPIGKEPVKAASSSNSKSIPKAAPCQNGLATKAAQRNPPIKADLNSSSKSLATKQPSLSSKSNQPPAKPVASKSQSANRPSAPSGPQRTSAPMGSKQMPPNKGKTLAPVGAGSRPFPPYRDMYPPMHRPPAKRAYESDEEEFDSEMEDFIDDDPQVDTSEVSSVIRSIFGSRYRRRVESEDDDDDCMESSYAQMMREEVRSAKIGLEEDLEDIRREEEEKKMKLAKKGGKRK